MITPQRTTMKRFLLRSLPAVAVIGLTANVNAQNRGVAVNATGAAPNDMAILDVSSTTKGMLIPRMTRADRLAIVAPPAGLWVYQTDDGTYTSGPLLGLPDPAEEKGYWYYEGAPTNAWVRWSTGRSAWQTTGNAGTTASPPTRPTYATTATTAI